MARPPEAWGEGGGELASSTTDEDVAGACAGRNEHALTELEALVREGLDLGWRNLAVDAAYEAIRSDPRFRAVSNRLKEAETEAAARFRARPDLNDADIDSLGT